MYVILFYDYVPDILARREPYRAAHLALLRELEAQGLVRMAGAYNDPADGAAIVFTGREAAERFVEQDPYIANGLVTAHRVRDWNVVIGA